MYIMLQWAWEYNYLLETIIWFSSVIPRTEIAGSFDNSMLNFFWNLHVRWYLIVIYLHFQRVRHNLATKQQQMINDAKYLCIYLLTLSTFDILNRLDS